MRFTEYIPSTNPTEVPSTPPRSPPPPDIIIIPSLLPTANPILAPKKSSSVPTIHTSHITNPAPSSETSILHPLLFLKQHPPTLRYILTNINNPAALPNLTNHSHPEELYASGILPTYSSNHILLMSHL